MMTWSSGSSIGAPIMWQVAEWLEKQGPYEIMDLDQAAFKYRITVERIGPGEN